MKNVTLSIPEDLLVRSREYARKHGTTLNQMVRDLLKRNVQTSKGSVADSIIEHADRTAVSMKGYKWNRNDAYED
jgi:hypothetical protein